MDFSKEFSVVKETYNMFPFIFSHYHTRVPFFACLAIMAAAGILAAYLMYKKNDNEKLHFTAVMLFTIPAGLIAGSVLFYPTEEIGNQGRLVVEAQNM